MASASGSIGIRQDLEVRAGHTLTPQVAVIRLSSGAVLDATGGSLVCRVLLRETDADPLIDPSFDPPMRLANDPDGNPRWLITQSRTLLSAVLAAAGPEPVVPYGGSWRRKRRRLWWTCSYQDAAGQLLPLYYGIFDIFLGAAGE